MKRWQGVVGGVWGPGHSFHQVEPRQRRGSEGRRSGDLSVFCYIHNYYLW